MDNSNLVEGTMETVDTVIFRAISEIRSKSKCPDEARIYNFVKDFLDDSGVSDVSFWERMKTLEDQGVIINRLTKCGSSFFWQNPCMNHLIVIQILSIPPLKFSSQAIHLFVQTTIKMFLY